MCMYAESLYCPPETVTTLLIGYTPIQFFVKSKKKKKDLKVYTNVAPMSFWTGNKLIRLIFNLF